MPCYSPVPAYQAPESGQVFFAELRRYAKDMRPIYLPCGKCIGCQMDRARQWGIRCVHEASLYQYNSFVTLTYSNNFLPPNGSLQYPDFQRFLKRLRKVNQGAVRFFMCGEYGAQTARPHYHALLFNVGFTDKVKIRQLDSGCDIYRSETLEKLWPLGNSSIGDVTVESANYVARYCIKKQLPRQGLPKEFIHMSLKPGIGKKWLDKFHKDVYTYDYVIINGKECKPPKYYDKQLDKYDLEEIKYQRYVEAVKHLEHTTPQRLADRETVANARLNFYKRELE